MATTSRPDRHAKCGEVFTRAGAWVEGALLSASAVADRILGLASPT